MWQVCEAAELPLPLSESIALSFEHLHGLTTHHDSSAVPSHNCTEDPVLALSLHDGSGCSTMNGICERCKTLHTRVTHSVIFRRLIAQSSVSATRVSVALLYESGSSYSVDLRASLKADHQLNIVREVVSFAHMSAAFANLPHHCYTRALGRRHCFRNLNRQIPLSQRHCKASHSVSQRLQTLQAGAAQSEVAFATGV